jgi:hypothetical protein
MVQEGQAAEAKRTALEQGLRRIGQECFGDDPAAVAVEWRTVRRGFGFTAGEPSTSSLVIRSVPVGLPIDERERFLRRVCELFETETGCHTDEVVVTAWDGPLPL